MTIAGRWRAVLDRVAGAAARAGRRPDEVTVVAAAKTFAAPVVAEAIAAGVCNIGENYVQEAIAKQGAIGASAARWHLIGRLQRNKAARAVEAFDWVHTLDSVPLADSLGRAGERTGKTLRCLIQVNLAAETTKAGVLPERLEELATAMAGRPGLSIEGLMTIPPPVEHAEQSRRHFARLRELLERLSSLRLPGVQPKELSMGMSADYEVAVEEGATFVRIGTALFGARESSR